MRFQTLTQKASGVSMKLSAVDCVYLHEVSRSPGRGSDQSVGVRGGLG